MSNDIEWKDTSCPKGIYNTVGDSDDYIKVKAGGCISRDMGADKNIKLRINTSSSETPPQKENEGTSISTFKELVSCQSALTWKKLNRLKSQQLFFHLGKG